MQTRPDQSTLLEALGSFLLTEVSPKLEADKALQFRVLIAANLPVRTRALSVSLLHPLKR